MSFTSSEQKAPQAFRGCAWAPGPHPAPQADSWGWPRLYPLTPLAAKVQQE